MQLFVHTVRAYCSCLTVGRDQEALWRDYAEQGQGFALGFDLFEIARIQNEQFTRWGPWLICQPVVYDRDKQRDMVGRVIAAAISDVKRFNNHFPTKAKDLTVFYQRVLLEAVTMLVTCIDFIKDPGWMHEREMRIVADPNDGTFDVQGIQNLKGDAVPFLFHDLRDPGNRRLPLKEIIIGPNAGSHDEVSFVERAIEEAGHKSVAEVRPRIVRSLLSRWA